MTIVRPDFSQKTANEALLERERMLSNVRNWHQQTVEAQKEFMHFEESAAKLKAAISDLDATCKRCAQSWKTVDVKPLYNKSIRLKRIMSNYLVQNAG